MAARPHGPANPPKASQMDAGRTGEGNRSRDEHDQSLGEREDISQCDRSRRALASAARAWRMAPQSDRFDDRTRSSYRGSTAATASRSRGGSCTARRGGRVVPARRRRSVSSARYTATAYAASQAARTSGSVMGRIVCIGHLASTSNQGVRESRVALRSRLGESGSAGARRVVERAKVRLARGGINGGDR